MYVYIYIYIYNSISNLYDVNFAVNVSTSQSAVYQGTCVLVNILFTDIRFQGRQPDAWQLPCQVQHQTAKVAVLSIQLRSSLEPLNPGPHSLCRGSSL